MFEVAKRLVDDYAGGVNENERDERHPNGHIEIAIGCAEYRYEELMTLCVVLPHANAVEPR